MIIQGRLLTEEQKLELHEQFFSDSTRFNVIKDINNNYVLPLFTAEDESYIVDTLYSWVLTLPISSFELPPPPSII